MKLSTLILPALVLAVAACGRIEQRPISENQCVLVKKIRGQEKLAFPVYPYFPYGDKKVPNEMFMYDNISHDERYEDLYIATIGTKKWAIDGIGKKIFQEPLLGYEFLGWGITKTVLQDEYEYYRFTTEKGVYFGILYHGWEVKGPYEDIFMLGSGSFLYKENGKWGASGTSVKAEYDALFEVHEVTAARGRRIFLLGKKNSEWKAVDFFNCPVSLSRQRIKEYLQIKPNASGYLEGRSITNIRRQRIGNDEVGYIDIQDVWG